MPWDFLLPKSNHLKWHSGKHSLTWELVLNCLQILDLGFFRNQCAFILKFHFGLTTHSRAIWNWIANVRVPSRSQEDLKIFYWRVYLYTTKLTHLIVCRCKSTRSQDTVCFKKAQRPKTVNGAQQRKGNQIPHKPSVGCCFQNVKFLPTQKIFTPSNRFVNGEVSRWGLNSLTGNMQKGQPQFHP